MNSTNLINHQHEHHPEQHLHHTHNYHQAATVQSLLLLDPNYAQFRDQTRFWIQRVAVPLIMVIGLFGNLITVIIMTSRRMRSTTNMYLAALAFVDMFYLLLTFLLGLSHYPNMAAKRYSLYWHARPFLMMLTDACSNTSVWLTVTFTIERYIAVRYPMKGKVWCTEARAKKLIWFVFMFSILFASPVPFEWKVIEKSSLNSTQKAPKINSQDVSSPLSLIATSSSSSSSVSEDYVENDPDERGTLNRLEGDNEDESVVTDQPALNKGDSDHDLETVPSVVLALDYSDFGRNETYKTIYYWSTAVIFYFIPLISLTLFNSFLIKSVHHSQRERDKMTQRPSMQKTTNHHSTPPPPAQQQFSSTLDGTGKVQSSQHDLHQNRQRRIIEFKKVFELSLEDRRFELSISADDDANDKRTAKKTKEQSDFEKQQQLSTKRQNSLVAIPATIESSGNNNRKRNLSLANFENLSQIDEREDLLIEMNDDSSPGLIVTNSDDNQVVDLEFKLNNSSSVPENCDRIPEERLAKKNREVGQLEEKRDMTNTEDVEVVNTTNSTMKQEAINQNQHQITNSCKIISPRNIKNSLTTTTTNGRKLANSSSASSMYSNSTIQQQQSGGNSNQLAAAQPTSSSSQERRITIMLISVVILFLFCQIPSAAMLLYTSVHETIPNSNEHALLLAFGNIFNFLMAINAAGNFILYSFLSKKYRRTFVILFCSCFKSKTTSRCASSGASRYGNSASGCGDRGRRSVAGGSGTNTTNASWCEPPSQTKSSKLSQPPDLFRSSVQINSSACFEINSKNNNSNPNIGRMVSVRFGPSMSNGNNSNGRNNNSNNINFTHPQPIIYKQQAATDCTDDDVLKQENKLIDYITDKRRTTLV